LPDGYKFHHSTGAFSVWENNVQQKSFRIEIDLVLNQLKTKLEG
jgi:hypothetical protein